MNPKNFPQNLKKRQIFGLTALITGSTSGLGLAIARRFLSEGANIITTGRSDLNPQTTFDDLDLPVTSANHVHLQTDLSDDSQRRQLIQNAWNWQNKIDILVNCAGVDILTGSTKQLPFNEKLSKLWSVDVLATVTLSRTLGQQMAQQGKGVIINIGWDGSRRGLGTDSGQLFALTKGAVESFSRSLAQTLAPSVRINVIAPGWIQTKWGESAPTPWQEKIRHQTLSDRWGTPEEIASVALFLASDEASYINGQIIDINGGFAYR